MDGWYIEARIGGEMVEFAVTRTALGADEAAARRQVERAHPGARIERVEALTFARLANAQARLARGQRAGI